MVKKNKQHIVKTQSIPRDIADKNVLKNLPTKSFKNKKNKKKQSAMDKAAIAKILQKRQYFMAKMLKKKKIFKSFFKISARQHFFKALIKYFVYIRINANNTIVSLTNLSGEVQHSYSAGLLKLRSSKRSYKYVYALVLKKFFDFLLKKKKIRNYLYFRIIAPKHLRRVILRKIIKPRFRKKKKRIMIEFLRLLPFNGCRASKKRRKKRQGLRVFRT